VAVEQYQEPHWLPKIEIYGINLLRSLAGFNLGNGNRHGTNRKPHRASIVFYVSFLCSLKAMLAVNRTSQPSCRFSIFGIGFTVEKAEATETSQAVPISLALILPTPHLSEVLVSFAISSIETLSFNARELHP
jgi:hypothetical protein